MRKNGLFRELGKFGYSRMLWEHKRTGSNPVFPTKIFMNAYFVLEILKAKKDEKEAVAFYSRCVALAKKKGNKKLEELFEHLLRDEREHVRLLSKV